MRVVLFFCLALALTPRTANANGLYAYGGGHYGGAGIYYEQDLNRLERNYRNLNQRYTRQLGRCQSDLKHQQRIYMEALSRQHGLGASIDELRAANETLRHETGTTQTIQQGPSQHAYDGLQERYDTLLTTYRNLQRDYRSLTEQP